jgi:hypothetical protein
VNSRLKYALSLAAYTDVAQHLTEQRQIATEDERKQAKQQQKNKLQTVARFCYLSQMCY